ncbi:MAG: hypothetical protein HY810_09645 [Candidatus Omnitrophica bacterium]|nr:hypothetical protein [Candidatus Omnitrophota bacterium]
MKVKKLQKSPRLRIILKKAEQWLFLVLTIRGIRQNKDGVLGMEALTMNKLTLLQYGANILGCFLEQKKTAGLRYNCLNNLNRT